MNLLHLNSIIQSSLTIAIPQLLSCAYFPKNSTKSLAQNYLWNTYLKVETYCDYRQREQGPKELHKPKEITNKNFSGVATNTQTHTYGNSCGLTTHTHTHTHTLLQNNKDKTEVL